MALSGLRDLLNHHFNNDELRQLCFDLDIEYENLPGDTRILKAQSLVAQLQRQGRVFDLITLVRHQRPTVNWPDPPPPTDVAAADARQVQAQALFARASQLLSPYVWNPATRDALFSEAFYPAHEWVLDQIDFAGEAAVFLPRCWQTLASFAPDGSLHTRLLLTLKPRCSHAQQRQIDDLIVTWQQVCAVPTAVPPAEITPPPLQPVLIRPGQPTLFLSCPDAEAPLAAHLAAELAACGYACQAPRPPDKGSPDWFTAVAAGLGNAYAVLLLVGAQTAVDHWQRVEYLAALDRHKHIIPILANDAITLPPYLPPGHRRVVYTPADETALARLRAHLPPPPPPARQNWANQAAGRRPRLAELAYMDRLKLDVLQHVALYTRLSGQAALQRTPQARLRLNPVVARQEFSHAPWRPAPEMRTTPRRFEDAVTELQAIRRAVLLGDPGSGKTTTFYKLADDLVDAALTDPTAPVPLLVSLGLWTEAAEPFPAFLRRSVSELGEGLEERLQQGRAALLLDGINELPADQQADKYRQVGAFLAQHPTLPAWVSCREQDYPPERDLRLDRVTVAPLDPVRVQEFIHNYLDGLPGYGPEAAAGLFWQLAGAKAQETHRRFMADLGAKLDDPERTFWLDGQLPDGLTWGYYLWEAWLKERARPASLLLLASNPYMLFMLLDVYQAYDRTLPANRGQLFDRFVETLLVRERLWAWDENSGQVIDHPAGTALLAALTDLAFVMQQQRAEAGALTALPLAAVQPLLTERQRYQAASANLLTLGDEVRFAHQLLQEYFVARAMRLRIWGQEGAEPGTEAEAPPLKAAAIWQPPNWWEPTNWEEAAILLAGLHSDDCTRVLDWVADANPEVAARCIVESGAFTPEETKQRLRDRWLPRLTDLHGDPEARARAAVGRALGRIRLADGTPLDNRPGVGVDPVTGLPDIVWSAEEIPAGKYSLGDERGSYAEQPRYVTIPRPYRLARYPITHAQFQSFIEAPDRDAAAWWEGLPPDEQQFSEPRSPYANHPRENVSWYQAIAFCRWLTARLHAGELPPGPLTGSLTQYVITLPHDYEWEVAARWPNEAVVKRPFPWGQGFDAAKANTTEGKVRQTTAVGLYPTGRNSALDLYDLIGNVREWCRNRYERPDEDMDVEKVDISNAWRVVRGGSWLNERPRAARRDESTPVHRFGLNGFRVVVVRHPPSPIEH